MAPRFTRAFDVIEDCADAVDRGGKLRWVVCADNAAAGREPQRLEHRRVKAVPGRIERVVADRE